MSYVYTYKYWTLSNQIGYEGALPPNYDQVVQWLGKTYKSDVDDMYYIDDKTDYGNDVLISSPRLYMNGTNNQLLFTDLSGVTVSSYIGTAVPRVSGNVITFTIGYIEYILLSDGRYLTFQEGNGTYTIEVTTKEHVEYIGDLENIQDDVGTQIPRSHLNGSDIWQHPTSLQWKNTPLQDDGTSCQGQGDTDDDGYEWKCKVDGIGLNDKEGTNGAVEDLYSPVSAELYDVPLAVNGNGIDDKISTGVSMALNSKVKFIGKFNGDISSNQFFGQLSTDNSRFYISVFNGYFALRLGDNGGSLSTKIADNLIHTFLVENQMFYIDGVMVQNLSTATFGSGVGNFTMFDLDTASVPSNTDCLLLELYPDGSTLEYQGIPIKSGDTQGTQTAAADGMYDKVTDTILYSEGTGLTAYNGLMYQFDGTPIAWNYKDAQFDFNDLHYYFKRVDGVHVDMHTIYGTQQAGQDEIDSLLYVDGLTKVVTASDGIVYTKK